MSQTPASTEPILNKLATPELYLEIASYIPLHQTPQTLLSLALLDRTRYEIVLPILWMHLVIRDDRANAGIRALRTVLTGGSKAGLGEGGVALGPKVGLGLCVKGLYVLYMSRKMGEGANVSGGEGDRSADDEKMTTLDYLIAGLKSHLYPNLQILQISFLSQADSRQLPYAERLKLKGDLWVALSEGCKGVRKISFKGVCDHRDEKGRVFGSRSLPGQEGGWIGECRLLNDELKELTDLELKLCDCNRIVENFEYPLSDSNGAVNDDRGSSWPAYPRILTYIRTISPRLRRLNLDMGGQVLLPVELGLSGRPPLDPLLTLDFPNIESFSVTGIMSLDDESVVAPRAGEECRGVRGAKFYNRWHNLVEFQLVQRDVRRRVGVPSLMSIFTGTDEEGNVDIMERTFLPNLRYLMGIWIDIVSLGPKLRSLTRLIVGDTCSGQVPYLLREAVPGGLPSLRSLQIFVRFLPASSGSYGNQEIEQVLWYEEEDGRFCRAKTVEELQADGEEGGGGEGDGGMDDGGSFIMSTVNGNYFLSIRRGAPQLEELSVAIQVSAKEISVDGLVPILVQICKFKDLRRFNLTIGAWNAENTAVLADRLKSSLEQCCTELAGNRCLETVQLTGYLPSFAVKTVTVDVVRAQDGDYEGLRYRSTQFSIMQVGRENEVLLRIL